MSRFVGFRRMGVDRHACLQLIFILSSRTMRVGLDEHVDSADLLKTCGVGCLI
jgi:hypothetical protein